MTVSGGTNILRYSLTASVYHETGIMETDDTLPYDTGSKLTRFNMRANVDLDLTKPPCFVSMWVDICRTCASRIVVPTMCLLMLSKPHHLYILPFIQMVLSLLPVPIVSILGQRVHSRAIIEEQEVSWNLSSSWNKT